MSAVDVVVLNHDDDVLEGIRLALEMAGLKVACRHSSELPADVSGFILEHQPRVVVFHLGPPPVAQGIATMHRVCEACGSHRPFVVTTSAPVELSGEPCVVSCVLLEPMDFANVREAVEHAISGEPFAGGPAVVARPKR